MASVDEQVSVLMRGSEFGDPQIKEIMARELRQRLTDAGREGRPLRVYCGYDVTAPDIHLGHTITMRKLRQFQDFGHEVTFLIGTFTTLIGDPSDKDEERKVPLSEQIERNSKTYIDQAFKVLDSEKTLVRYNGDWLSKLTFADVIKMASNFTVQQFLTRDRLRNRIEQNKPLGLRELLYPLAQGYDAVHMQSDVQLGATEQLFNLMAGRKLQESFGLKPQICLTFPVLVGTDGTLRMSKSTGNYIGVAEPPEEQFGKIMSIPDSVMMHYFELLTDVPESEMAEMHKAMDSGVNPMEFKKRLAREIVGQLNGEPAAVEAEAHFARVVQNKELNREDMEDLPVDKYLEGAAPGQSEFTGVDIGKLLAAAGKVKSRGEAGRLISQGGISIDGEKLSSAVTDLRTGSIIKIGKRRYVRVTNSGGV